MPASLVRRHPTRRFRLTTGHKGRDYLPSSLGVGLILIVAAIVAARADDGSAEATAPAPLTEYKGRTIAPTMTYHGADWLTRKEREQEEHCKTLLKALNIKPGQAVCDMGCGNGFYTLRLAKLVGKQGRVLAVDVQPEMLHLLDLRAKQSRFENIEPIQGTLTDPKLPEGEVDLILLVDVYHEFSHPEQML
ncbi:MAG TPA: methyltransferase domain-containing protein, partial [Pirellulales bacterium]|nr:methyltransferase domain-containing protein [Pirellulales bacterium]